MRRPRKDCLFEDKLGLVPNDEDDLEARLRGIQQRTEERSVEIEQQYINNLNELERRRNWIQLIKNQVDRIPILKREARDKVATKTQKYNSQLAAVLGIHGWDDTQPIEEQFRLIREKILEIRQPVTATSIAPTPVTRTPVATTSVAATAQSREEAVKEELTAIESKHKITPDNENDLDARYRFLQQHLQQEKAEKTI